MYNVHAGKKREQEGMKVGNDFGSTSLRPNPSNSVTKLNLHPYHEMGQPSPNRSVDNTEQFLVLALYAARNKTDASFDCQSISEDGSARYF